MKTPLLVAIGIILLGGLFFLFKPSATEAPQTATEQKNITTPKTISPTLSEIALDFEIIIKDKKLISGPATIQVSEGDEITIKVTSDEPEELHVHGYDKSIGLEPDIPATLTFITDTSGRFPFELENSQVEIGILEVQPK